MARSPRSSSVPAASAKSSKKPAAPKVAKAAAKAPAPKGKAPAKPAVEAGSFDALQAIHTAIARFDLAASRELSLNRSDAACLRVLLGGGKSATEIGRALGLTSGSVTALVVRLLNAKLVKRTESDSDRRAIHVEILPSAQRRLNKAYEPIIQALDGALGGKKRATVEALLAAARTLSAL